MPQKTTKNQQIKKQTKLKNKFSLGLKFNIPNSKPLMGLGFGILFLLWECVGGFGGLGVGFFIIQGLCGLGFSEPKP